MLESSFNKNNLGRRAPWWLCIAPATQEPEVRPSPEPWSWKPAWITQQNCLKIRTHFMRLQLLSMVVLWSFLERTHHSRSPQEHLRSEGRGQGSIKRGHETLIPNLVDDWGI